MGTVQSISSSVLGVTAAGAHATCCCLPGTCIRPFLLRLQSVHMTDALCFFYTKEHVSRLTAAPESPPPRLQHHAFDPLSLLVFVAIVCGTTLPCPALPYRTLPYPVLPCPALPYRTLSCPALPCPALPYPALPYHTLPCPAPPYPALPYPTLPYPTLPLQRNVPTHIRWANDLKDAAGAYLPHILRDSIDQTIHWANPAVRFRVWGLGLFD